MARPESTQTLASMIRTLGGPRFSPGDFEWATSLPAGKNLIDWLASQAATEASEGHAGINSTVALHSIALHEAEIKDAKIAEKAGIVTDTGRIDTTIIPSTFQSVATLRSRREQALSESELLETETAMLRHRLKSVKIASKEMAHTVKTLKASINGLDDQMRRREERLGDISIQVDTALSGSVNAASRLLSAADSDREKAGAYLKACSARLAEMTELRAQIAEITKERFHELAAADRSIPTALEVQREAERLHQQLNIIESPSGPEPGPETAESEAQLFCAELDGIAHQLMSLPEDVEKDQAVSDILATMEAEHDASTASADVDLVQELTRAWNSDQMKSMTARERVVDETMNMFSQCLLPPLDTLHAHLLASKGHAFEAEALVSALVEELEEVVDDVTSIRDSAGKDKSVQPQALLEDELRDELKQLQSLRPSDANPLVLLDEADLSKELASIPEWLSHAEDAEREWVVSLLDRLSSLTHNRASLLSTIYANSPVTTSPPFLPSATQQKLENDLQRRVEQLSNLTIRLEESRMTDRDERKLDAFIGKWART